MKTQCMQSWYKDMVPASEQSFYGGDACGSCASCVARCRGRVDIGRRVGQLKLHFA